MDSFKKKCYIYPVICQHINDLSKDWYVFFRFKNEGKVHRYKRREGINRIKKLNGKLTAIEELRDEIEYNLLSGWNPIKDPKRELEYNPLMPANSLGEKDRKVPKKSKSRILLVLFE